MSLCKSKENKKMLLGPQMVFTSHTHLLSSSSSTFLVPSLQTRERERQAHTHTQTEKESEQRKKNLSRLVLALIDTPYYEGELLLLSFLVSLLLKTKLEKSTAV